MYYRISVAVHGKHLFATADHSLPDKERFTACLKILRRKFPTGQGYTIQCTHWTHEGRSVTDLGDIRCQ